METLCPLVKVMLQMYLRKKLFILEDTKPVPDYK